MYLFINLESLNTVSDLKEIDILYIVYCRLFASKMGYKGGATGTSGPPLATPMRIPLEFIYSDKKSKAYF